MKTLTQSRRSYPLRSLQDEINQLFESVFPEPTRDDEESSSAIWSPRTDVTESENTYRLSIDLPGMSKEDVSIKVQDNRLTIRGERKGEMRSDAENVVRMERTFGTFVRTLRLPTSVSAEKITATFDNGVLSVTLPKTEKSNPKEITIS